MTEGNTAHDPQLRAPARTSSPPQIKREGGGRAATACQPVVFGDLWIWSSSQPKLPHCATFYGHGDSIRFIDPQRPPNARVKPTLLGVYEGTKLVSADTIVFFRLRPEAGKVMRVWSDHELHEVCHKLQPQNQSIDNCVWLTDDLIKFFRGNGNFDDLKPSLQTKANLNDFHIEVEGSPWRVGNPKAFQLPGTTVTIEVVRHTVDITEDSPPEGGAAAFPASGDARHPLDLDATSEEERFERCRAEDLPDKLLQHLRGKVKLEKLETSVAEVVADCVTSVQKGSVRGTFKNMMNMVGADADPYAPAREDNGAEEKGPSAEEDQDEAQAKRKDVRQPVPRDPVPRRGASDIARVEIAKFMAADNATDENGNLLRVRVSPSADAPTNMATEVAWETKRCEKERKRKDRLAKYEEKEAKEAVAAAEVHPLSPLSCHG
jgi:hypothetical protein